MNIFHIRVLLDSAGNIFRDIEIPERSTLAELHRIITDGFSFSGNELASFYRSNENWDKGQEIALVDMSDGTNGVLEMGTTYISDVVSDVGDRLLYVYDFYRMWIFFVEVVNVKPARPGMDYPRVTLAVGIAPAEYSRESAEDMEFKSDFEDSFYDEKGGGPGEDYDSDDRDFETFDDDLEYR